MKKILMMLFLVVSVMTLTTRCGDDFDYDQDTEVANSMIVGTWRDVDLSDGAEYWTFNSDGTGNLRFDDIEVSGYQQVDFTYTVTDTRLTVTANVEGKKVTETYFISFNSQGTTLTIMDPNDKEGLLILNKIK